MRATAREAPLPSAAMTICGVAFESSSCMETCSSAYTILKTTWRSSKEAGYTCVGGNLNPGKTTRLVEACASDEQKARQESREPPANEPP